MAAERGITDSGTSRRPRRMLLGFLGVAAVSAAVSLWTTGRLWGALFAPSSSPLYGGLSSSEGKRWWDLGFQDGGRMPEGVDKAEWVCHFAKAGGEAADAILPATATRALLLDSGHNADGASTGDTKTSTRGAARLSAALAGLQRLKKEHAARLGDKAAAVLRGKRSNSDTRLRVYMYDVPDELLFAGMQGGGQVAADRVALTMAGEGYSVEMELWSLLSCPHSKVHVRTHDPIEADVFFVPMFPVAVWHNNIFGEGKLAQEDVAGAQEEYLRAIWEFVVAKGYILQDSGYRHLFALSHDCRAAGVMGSYGTSTMRNLLTVGPCSVAFAPVAPAPGSTRARIVGWNNKVPLHTTVDRDAVLPVVVSAEQLEEIQAARRKYSTWAERPKLFQFRGSDAQFTQPDYSLGIRQGLYALYGAAEYATVVAGHAPNYADELAEAKFCLHPRGWTAWSARLGQLMHAGCIPVILSDAIVLPFEEFVTWSKFSIKISVDDALKPGELRRQLAAITAEQAATMLHNMEAAARLLTFSMPPAVHSVDAWDLMIGAVALRLGAPLMLDTFGGSIGWWEPSWVSSRRPKTAVETEMSWAKFQDVHVLANHLDRPRRQLGRPDDSEGGHTERTSRAAQAQGGTVVSVFIYDVPPDISLAAGTIELVGTDHIDVEMTLHRHFQHSPSQLIRRVRDPADADYLYIPTFTVALRTSQRHLPEATLRQREIDYLASVLSWVRENGHLDMDSGRRHLMFVRVGDKCGSIMSEAAVLSGVTVRNFATAGPGVGFVHPVRAMDVDTPRAKVKEHLLNVDSCYNVGRDIATPTLFPSSVLEIVYQMGAQRPAEQRSTLATLFMDDWTREEFDSDLSARLQRRLADQLQQSGERVAIVRGTAGMGSHSVFINSKYCIFTWRRGGASPVSAEFAYAAAGGCIPVLVADGIVLPFEDQLDWRAGLLKFSERRCEQRNGLVSLLRQEPRPPRPLLLQVAVKAWANANIVLDMIVWELYIRRSMVAMFRESGGVAGWRTWGEGEQ